MKGRLVTTLPADRRVPSLHLSAALAMLLLLWIPYTVLFAIDIGGIVGAVVQFIPGVLSVLVLFAAGFSRRDCYLRVASLSQGGALALSGVAMLIVILTIVSIGLGGIVFARFSGHAMTSFAPDVESIALPAPVCASESSVEMALRARRSTREYSDAPLTLADVGQLLWAAQAVTHPAGYRTAPSAGALYPLGVYLVAGNVRELEPGIYKYMPSEHALIRTIAGDKRRDLSDAALGQQAVEDAAAVIVITGVFERTTVKYGERGIRYVYMESGSAAQNVYLQAVSRNLGTVYIGAFHDDDVSSVLELPPEVHPLCLLPVGRPGE